MIHLHLHTKYSAGDALASSADYCKRAGSGSVLAITDHDNMGGILEHKYACQKFGVKPIYGVEATLDGMYHITLLAENNSGLKNLYAFMQTPKSLDDLEKFSSGIIALSGDLKSPLSVNILKKDRDTFFYYLNRLKSIFKGSFYLELIDHGLEEQKYVNSVFEKINLPKVRTNDVHYLNKSDAVGHGILVCDRMKKVADLDWLLYHGIDSAYLKDLGDDPVAMEIADRCTADIVTGKTFLPKFEIPDSFKSQGEYLKFRAENGLKDRGVYGINSYMDRLEEELTIIGNMGFEGYFLIVWDFIKYAHDRKIPVGPGRGSGAGSLVAYALKITNVDPLVYDLLFERFLNPERVSMPDFDIDFCQLRRGEVINYVKEKYGEECVGGIATYGELKPRAAWKSAARVLNISIEEQHMLSKLLPNTTDSEKLSDLFVYGEPTADASDKLKAAMRPQYVPVLNVATTIESSYKNIGRHAAGILIADDRLEKYLPVWNLDEENCPVDLDSHTVSRLSQVTMSDAEKMGLVKFDFLGLKELTVMEYAKDLIKKEHGIELDYDNLPLNDKKTFDLISTGDTLGIFQISNKGFAAFMKFMKPDSLHDIIAAVALYRPGPMDFEGGMHTEYVKRKHGEEFEYPHEDLVPIMDETYGILVYQEQVMRIAQDIGGYTLGGADILRRAMGKKNPQEMESQKSIFTDGALKRGYDRGLVDTLWDQMETFSRYGFNKSHATAYGMLSYITGYLKANYAPELLAAQMQVRSDKPEQVSDFIRDAKMMGIEVVETDLQSGNKNFSTRDGKIYTGLSSIKGLNDETMNRIEECAPFKDLYDFMVRAKPSTSDVRALAYSGSLDTLLSYDPQQARPDVDSQIKVLINSARKVNDDQLTLFGHSNVKIKRGCTDRISIDRMLELEFEYLERYRNIHPIDRYRDRADRIKCTKINDIEEVDGVWHRICAIARSVEEITTYNNDRMAFVAMEDETGRIDVTVFPDAYASTSFEIGKPVFMEVKTNIYDDKFGAIFQNKESV